MEYQHKNFFKMFVIKDCFNIYYIIIILFNVSKSAVMYVHYIHFSVLSELTGHLIPLLPSVAYMRQSAKIFVFI